MSKPLKHRPSEVFQTWAVAHGSYLLRVYSLTSMCSADLCEGQAPSAFPVFLLPGSLPAPVTLCLLKVTIITKVPPLLHSIILALGCQYMNLGTKTHSVHDIFILRHHFVVSGEDLGPQMPHIPASLPFPAAMGSDHHSLARSAMISRSVQISIPGLSSPIIRRIQR